MAKIKTFKAAVFKLHNPSNHKKAMLLDSMKRAERAYWAGMSLAENYLKGLLKTDKKERRKALFELKELVRKKITPLPISVASKYGVLEDVIAQVSSYIELMESGQEATFPEREAQNTNYYETGLERVINSIDEKEYLDAKDMMHRKERPQTPRPLTIVQNHFSKGMVLLRDDRGRLFTWLNLHNRTSRFAKQKAVKGLINIRTGEISSWKSITGDLFPLECGDWHFKDYIECGVIQSCKVFIRNNEFYLAISFLFEAEKAETKTVLGIDRGIENIAGWAVIDHNHATKNTGLIEGVTLREYQRKKEKLAARKQRLSGMSKIRWRGYADNIIHIAANIIVEMAVKHKSQVVMEDLTNIANGPQHKRLKFKRKTNFARLLNRQQYQKLCNVLEYKLASVGLPQPKLVHPAWTSLTCSKCGNNDKENRKEQAVFKCCKCGYTEHADINASINIGLKNQWWNEIKPKIKKGDKIKDSQRYEVWLCNVKNQGAGNNELLSCAS